jgi:hypothetical protein
VIDMEQRKRHLALRVLVALPTLLAALLAIELLTFGSVLAGISSSAEPSPEDFLPLLGGIGLAALCAAGVKYVFHLRVRYWILLLATLVALTLVVLAVQAGIFLG